MKIEAMMDDLFPQSDFKKHESKWKMLMPFDKQRPVVEQFRWVPLSVFTPDKSTYWDSIIDDKGDAEKVNKVWNTKKKTSVTVRYSKFHPQLAEVVIRYWSSEGDLVVDPFAGRATRGIVSLKLGRKYQGYEVAPKTFALTKTKVDALGGKLQFSDGCLLSNTQDESADFVFTCPPYHRLEEYESAKSQLSDIEDYGEFFVHIKECGRNAYRVLKPGKFFCWVCADWRDASNLVLFHVDCIKAFQRVGFEVHDIVVVKNHSMFAALKAPQSAARRVTSKIHEYLLVFRKPDSKK